MPEPVDTAHPAPAQTDAAVEFLAALVPPSPGERTRAFAALLRAMTTPAVQR